jgi:CheY-like chemotaxis protein
MSGAALMPGMDGFEAVRALKANARTQSIPVMMYSSQDGPEYLREAMTCGAVGVLPKTLTQTDVSRALYQLHLLPDRREGHAPARMSESVQPPQHAPERREAATRPDADRARDAATTPTEVRAAVASMLKTYDADLRHALHSEFEAMTRRLLESQRATMGGDAPAEDTRTATTASPATSAPWLASAPPRSGSHWWIAATLGVLFVVVSAYAVQQHRLQTQLQKSNAQLSAAMQEQQTQIEALRNELMQRSATPAIETLTVPYGEAPFAGSRVVAIRDRILALQASGFKGTVQIDSYVGDFCLSGSAVTGFALARAELPVRRCDIIGNPFEDALADNARQSAEFADMLAMVTRNGTLPPQIKLSNSGRMPSQSYPAQTAENAETLTAGEWNKIAAVNHRVELSLLQQTAL